MEKFKVYLKGFLIVTICAFAAVYLFKSPLFYGTNYAGCEGNPGIFKRGEISRGIAKRNSLNKGISDISSMDISAADLKGKGKILENINFDTRVVWPNSLPENFLPSTILENGKNPGLNIAKLHAKGINGKGVSIAIIDQRIFTGHSEYEKRLRSYEEIHYFRFEELLKRQGHGEVMVSVIAGKTCGIAPESDIYYEAVDPGTLSAFKLNYYSYDFKWLAKAVERILEINEELSADKKIKVIAFAFAWPDESVDGYAVLMKVLREASDEGIFIASPLFDYYGYKIAGLSKKYFKNPDSFGSYEPSPLFVSLLKRKTKTKIIFAPGDSRTVASPYGKNEYAFIRHSKYAIVVSYMAGLFALSCQVNKHLKPEEFMAAAYKTAKKIRIKSEEIRIINPESLINTLRKSDFPNKGGKNGNIQ